MTASTTSIDFFFDPACPWTWATSRWLVEAAGSRGLDIEWRNLSLAVLNADQDVPEQYRRPMEMSALAHRVIAALHQSGRNDLVAALYTEYGRRVHHDGVVATPELVREVVESAGAGDYLAAADEEKWDQLVEESTGEAIALVGPGVGSPVLAFGTPRFAIFGPIVSPPPRGDDGARLLDVVLSTAEIPGFSELKRGRTSGPDPGPRP